VDNAHRLFDSKKNHAALYSGSIVMGQAFNVSDVLFDKCNSQTQPNFWTQLQITNTFKTWEYIYIYIYFVEILIYKSRRYDSSLSLRNFPILWYKYLIVFEKAFLDFDSCHFCRSLLILLFQVEFGTDV